MLFDQAILQREIGRTKPDFVLFSPKKTGYEDDNVHLHVVRHEMSGRLIAVWTQSSYDGSGDNHAMIAYSRDDGVTWTEPRYVAGAVPEDGTNGKQASWAFPVVSRSGKIYLFYFRETDYVDNHRGISAVLACMTSDDFGETWSESTDIPMRMTPFDSCEVQNNNIYQAPRRMPDGKYLFAYTKWTGYRVKARSPKWYEDDSHVYFMRCENLDDDPEPCDLRFTFLPDDERGVGIPIGDGDRSVAQEPCPVSLPDGRLFCTVRTSLGHAAYTVSSDGGHTWSVPSPIRFTDGSVFVHPLSPCPIFETRSGVYALLFHGNADDVGGSRNPLYRAVGRFAPDAEQPIRFEREECTLFMALPEEASIPGHTNNQLAMYSSAVKIGDRTVLWYPDRKCFLLGKYLD